MQNITNNNATYNALAMEYAKKALQREVYNSEIIDRFIGFIKTGKVVLDIGCAVGLDLSILKRRKLNPVGIESSEEMVKIARKKHPEIKIILGDFIETQFDVLFDAIFAQSFIHLFPQNQALTILSKIYSILKKGGVLHITTTKSYESKEGWEVKTDYLGGHQRYRKHYTMEELIYKLNKANFSIVDYYEKEDPFGKVGMYFCCKK